jgi:rhamnosyltransferase
MTQVETLVRNLQKIIVVDNSSENIGELEYSLKKFGNKIEIIKLDDNFGIGKALNIGIERALNIGKYDYILTLDQDTTFYQDTFENANSEILKLVDRNGPGLFGLNFVTKRFAMEITRNTKKTPIAAKHIITSGTIISLEILKTIKFDETMFIYFVDDDFCFKVRKMGYKIMILGKSKMMHNEGQRIMKDNNSYFYIQPERMYYLARNSLIMLKRYGYIKAIIFVIYVGFMNLFAGIKIKKMVKYYFKGIFDGIIES